MLFASITPCTLLDFPDKIAAILFTAGCNFRCGYCHNPSFVDPEKICTLSKSFLPESTIMNFLEQRRGLLEGVVICGGEPTIHPDLERIVEAIHAMGFLVKLDTNGSNPEALARLLEKNLLSYVAMDVKATEERYRELVGRRVETEKIRRSISMLRHSNVPHEFRTTVLPEFHSLSALRAIGEMIHGAPLWALQQCRMQHTLDPSFAENRSYSPTELSCLQGALTEFAEKVIIRY